MQRDAIHTAMYGLVSVKVSGVIFIKYWERRSM